MPPTVPDATEYAILSPSIKYSMGASTSNKRAIYLPILGIFNGFCALAEAKQRSLKLGIGGIMRDAGD